MNWWDRRELTGSESRLLKQICYHEASHAVAADGVGLATMRIEIYYKDGSTKQDSSYDTTTDEGLFNYIVTLYAGGEGELFAETSPDPSVLASAREEAYEHSRQDVFEAKTLLIQRYDRCSTEDGWDQRSKQEWIDSWDRELRSRARELLSLPPRRNAVEMLGQYMYNRAVQQYPSCATITGEEAAREIEQALLI